MQLSTLLPLALALSAAEAVYQGFNYGSTFTDNSPKAYQDFVNEFNAAKSLAGTNGAFTSARLYTMVQAGTTNTPITALQAAQDTQTSLLLGLWASAGDAAFAQEMTALKSAISQFSGLKSQIAGISVGSEDLYRVSPVGIENMSGIGAGPDVVSNYIGQVKAAIAGTSWDGIPVGHVDTWTAWVNGSNSAVVTASDWIGVDAYPYFQNTMANGIDNGASLFNEAYANTEGASSGKPVWITETGWPISGPESNQAVANTDNAKTYWDAVGCPNFGVVNTWWYTLQDAAPTTPSPSFGILGSNLNSAPAYDLSCANVDNSTSAASATASASGATSVPTAGGVSPSQGAGNGAPQYSNSTTSGSGSSGSSSTNGTSTSGSGSSGSGSGSSSGSGSGSGSGTSTSSGSGSTVSSYTGTASSTLKGSAIGLLGVVAAAVALL